MSHSQARIRRAREAASKVVIIQGVAYKEMPYFVRGSGTVIARVSSPWLCGCYLQAARRCSRAAQPTQGGARRPSGHRRSSRARCSTSARARCPTARRAWPGLAWDWQAGGAGAQHAHVPASPGEGVTRIRAWGIQGGYEIALQCSAGGSEPAPRFHAFTLSRPESVPRGAGRPIRITFSKASVDTRPLPVLDFAQAMSQFGGALRHSCVGTCSRLEACVPAKCVTGG